MINQLKITGIDVHQYEYETANVAKDDEYNGFNIVYKPKSTLKQQFQI